MTVNDNDNTISLFSWMANVDVELVLAEGRAPSVKIISGVTQKQLVANVSSLLAKLIFICIVNTAQCKRCFYEI